MSESRTAQITYDRVREVLTYCPDNGVFRWKIGRPKVRIGDLAGTVTSQGYLQICVDYVQHRAHRLAWLLMTGRLPFEIDHIDRDRLNNRWSNLREVAPGENQKNRGIPKNNTSGFIGVSFVRSNGTWKCAFQCDKRRWNRGGFISAEAASRAYEELRAKYGRALSTPANDCPSDRQALLPVLNYGPCAHVDTPCAGAGLSFAGAFRSQVPGSHNGAGDTSFDNFHTLTIA